MCWVAADRGAKLARVREEQERAKEWQAAADEMKADILANGVDERGVFTQYYGSDALDASTCSSRWSGSCRWTTSGSATRSIAIAEELTDDGLVLRYRVEHTDDGLAGEEGTFTICSFWLVSAPAR